MAFEVLNTVGMMSRIVFLCRCGDLLGLLIAIAAGAISTVGVFRCFGGAASNLGCARIEEQQHPWNEELQQPEKTASEWEADITIRLEDSFLPTLQRHRCIATIRRPASSAQDTGCEIWYARGEQ